METPTLDQIRVAVAEAVEASSLRAVARQVDMSATGLQKFIKGAAPYAPTLRRLYAWYETWTASDPDRRLGARVEQLVELVEPADREEARNAVLRVLKGVRLIAPLSLAEQAPRPSYARPAGPGRSPAVPAGHTRCGCGEVVRWSQYLAHSESHARQP